ncbi:hypothetical protein [Kitasatospora sp. McL0602]|uniref:hypothetical protein n=1 Tax=Kitasatospora sp. McL0602 TaxID=3439530 RepID=UPI003F8A8CB7
MSAAVRYGPEKPKPKAIPVPEIPENAHVNPRGRKTSSCHGCQLFDAWAVVAAQGTSSEANPWIGRQRNRHREWGECDDPTRGGTFKDPEDGGEGV